MYERNKMGPRTEPCRTPEETEIVPKWMCFFFLLVTMDCFLLFNFFIHLRLSPLMP